MLQYHIESWLVNEIRYIQVENRYSTETDGEGQWGSRGLDCALYWLGMLASGSYCIIVVSSKMHR